MNQITNIFLVASMLMSDVTKTTHIMGMISYSYGYDFEDDPLPQIPPLKIVGSVGQRLMGFTVQPEVTWSAAQDRISAKFEEAATPSFWLVNLRVFKTLKLEKSAIDVSTGIENLLDENYREHFDWGNIPRPGRNFYLNVSWKL